MSDYGEPWKLKPGSYKVPLEDGDTCFIAARDDRWLGFGRSSDEGEIYVDEITKRVVACVNACQGIPTEVLENMPSGSLEKLVGRIIELRNT
jgi:hypothetical protein